MSSRLITISNRDKETKYQFYKSTANINRAYLSQRCHKFDGRPIDAKIGTVNAGFKKSMEQHRLWAAIHNVEIFLDQCVNNSFVTEETFFSTYSCNRVVALCTKSSYITLHRTHLVKAASEKEYWYTQSNRPGSRFRGHECDLHSKKEIMWKI